VIAFGVALCSGKLTLLHQSLLERSDEMASIKDPGQGTGRECKRERERDESLENKKGDGDGQNRNDIYRWTNKSTILTDETGVRFRWANKSTILTNRSQT
jgi:hypothetical protein